METFETIVGIIFACLLLLLAFKLYSKDRVPSAVLVAWAAVFILVCSFTWFQGWAKSFIASNIFSRLKAIGEQVNTVQATTTDMLNQFSNQVNTLQQTDTAMQNELSKHQVQIDTNQFALGIAQTNLLLQATKLSDVEYMVQHLYDLTTNETFRAGDTNNLYFFDPTNNVVRYIVRLSNVPIAGSIERGLKDNIGESKDYLGTFVSNVAGGLLAGYDTNTVSLTFHYVIDTRKTNFYKTMPVLNKDFFLGSNNTFFIKPLN